MNTSVARLAESVGWGTWQATGKASQAESFQQAGILRDIFGNPFRSIALDLAWFTPAVTSLAQDIYDQRDFDRLSILADGLEPLGCFNPDMVSQCRRPGEHVRGVAG